DWGLLFNPLLTLTSLRGASLKGLRRVVQGQLSAQIIHPTLLITFLLLFSAFSDKTITADQAMALRVLAMSIGFVVAAWLLHRAQPEPIKAKPEPEYHGKIWFKAVMPFALISGMDQLNRNLDLVILGLFE